MTKLGRGAIAFVIAGASLVFVACGSSGSSGSGGSCNSGPGLCTDPVSGNHCRNGAVCEQPCATCDYGCYKDCSSDADCAGFCASDGSPLKCTSYVYIQVCGT